jgi:hypothetical protein
MDERVLRHAEPQLNLLECYRLFLSHDGQRVSAGAARQLDEGRCSEAARPSRTPTFAWTSVERRRVALAPRRGREAQHHQSPAAHHPPATNLAHADRAAVELRCAVDSLSGARVGAPRADEELAEVDSVYLKSIATLEAIEFTACRRAQASLCRVDARRARIKRATLAPPHRRSRCQRGLSANAIWRCWGFVERLVRLREGGAEPRPPLAAMEREV